jgi:hypothetical protein
VKLQKINGINLKPTYCQYKLYGYDNYIKTEINYESKSSKLLYQKLISYDEIDSNVNFLIAIKIKLNNNCFSNSINS